MNGRPIRWRARWALAQVTGTLFSTAVWIVLLASAPWVMAAMLLGGVVLVAGLRSHAVLWLVFGARPADGSDREEVLRAIVPLSSLRVRHQPVVFVGRGFRARGWDVLASGQGVLLVSESLLAGIRAGRLTDVEVSVRVAYALGQLPVVGSRIVLAVRVYCLPWVIVEAVAFRIVRRLARVPLMSLAWRMRPLVLGLGLLDAVQHGRWEAAVPLLVLAVLTYTTGPLNRAWRRKLAEMGSQRVAQEGLELAPVVASYSPSHSRDVRSTHSLEVSHE